MAFRRDMRVLLEEGSVDVAMKCPSCFAYGSDRWELCPAWNGADHWVLIPASAHPECLVCGGAGTVSCHVEGSLGLAMADQLEFGAVA